MAVITKGRTKGTYEFRLGMGRDLNGKRLRENFTARGTKKDVETRMAEMVRLINKGDDQIAAQAIHDLMASVS